MPSAGTERVDRRPCGIKFGMPDSTCMCAGVEPSSAFVMRDVLVAHFQNFIIRTYLQASDQPIEQHEKLFLLSGTAA